WSMDPNDAMSQGPGGSVDRTWSDRGGYVTNFDEQFDPTGFAVSADKIRALDPVVQWTCHTAREALRDAGYADADSSRSGAIFGNLSFPSAGMANFTQNTTINNLSGYGAESLAAAGLQSPDPLNRFNSGLPALLLERALDLGSGALALDAACSSSLYAIKLACDQLHDGTANLMLAGAVNCADDLCIHIGFSALQALSRTGRSRPFHRDADGLVPAEGCGFVVLRRLDDALNDGDTIHGIIRGVGLSNDGRGRGMLVPSTEGQARAMAQALEMSGLTPADISLLEAHATGTQVGDATEIESSAAVYGTCQDLPIGSLKSNTGHLITAAGVAGLIKVIEAMRHETLPPTLHVEEPLDAISDSPFRLIEQAESWDRSKTSDGVLRAGVSAFGFGGNNAHLIVEEGGEKRAVSSAFPGHAQVLAPSARTWLESEANDGGGAQAPGWRPPPYSASGASSAFVSGTAGPSSFTPDGAPAHPAPIAVVGIGISAAAAVGREAFVEALLSNTSCLDTSGEGRMPDISLQLANQKFPPNDLKAALAQQLAILAVADEATQDSGPLPNETTGVYVAMGTDTEAARFGIRWRIATLAKAWDLPPEWVQTARDLIGPPLDAAGVIGTMPNIVANRLNSQYNMMGPSFTVSAEERGSLEAVKLAARALRAGEIDAALVGAVDLCCNQVHDVASQLLPADRQILGDAAAVLVLRRLDDAERDGNTIYSVLVDGRRDSNGAQLADRPDLRLGLTPEVHNLTEQFGHAHAASGLVHLAAAALSLHHRVHPGNVPLLSSNPEQGTGLPPGAGPRTASVEIDAMDGIARRTILLAEATEHPAPSPFASVAPRLHVYSGVDEAEVLQALSSGEESDSGPCRLVIVAASRQQLTERSARATAHITSGKPAGEGVHFRQSPIDGEMAFVFTAAGAAYQTMGAQLLRSIPELTDPVSAQFPLGEVANWVFQGDHSPSPDDFLWGTSLISQAHARLTRQLLNLQPSAAIGYSSGESSSLFAFGIWTDMAAMRREISASEMMDRELAVDFAAVTRAWGVDRADWRVWNLRASPADVRDAIADEDRVHLTIINTANDVLIGGDADACQRVLDRLGVRGVEIDYNLACHVPEVAAEFHDEWVAVHTRDVTPLAGLRHYSNGTNSSYEVSKEACAAAITSQAETTIDFPATIEAAYADGIRIFVEHGPGAVCSNYIREILGDREFLAVPLDRRDKSIEQIFEAAAALVSAGIAVDHQALTRRLSQRRAVTPASAGPALSFPTHPKPVQLPPRHIELREPQSMALAPALASVMSKQLVNGQHPESDGNGQQLEAATIAPLAASASTTNTVADAVAAIVARQLDDVAALHNSFLSQQSVVHQQFLNSRRDAIALLSSTPQIELSTETEPAQAATTIDLTTLEPQPEPIVIEPEPVAPKPAQAGPRGPTWDKQQLKIHSSGQISQLFGPMFEPQDQFEVQCRMPEPPLLLADRVTGLEAEPGVLGQGTIWTETDVERGAWYLNGGYMPAGFMIESGQADLMLISYMGIDLLNRGERAYRLLGCNLTYHGDLPSPGETLQYEIRITGHARHGDIRLFFFEYDCLVDGKPRLTVRDAQAGFFNRQELDDALGILWDPGKELDSISHDARVDPPTIVCTKSSFSNEEVVAFSEGRACECFGQGYEWAETHTRTPTIQNGKQLFIDEVTDFDPTGGPWGRGFLRGEAAIDDDEWFFDGHFKNDPCMPGNFMVEACIEAMSFYLAALGYTTRRDGWRFQPLPEQPFDLKCRGEINPATGRVAYELHVEEIWAGPHPTIICDVIGLVDGHAAFHAHRVGVELVPGWPLTTMPELYENTIEPVEVARDSDGFPFDWKAMISCAWGKPSEAFGSMYELFNGTRQSPRLPGEPYHFISRVVRIDGELDVCEAGMEIVCEYDIPSDAWYFDENGTETMPFAVLLEAALQPCGWVASAIGSVTKIADDMMFRNLDGTGTVVSELSRTAGTLTTHVKLTNV
ncbi:MAG: beta-ketoacyl synthase N-terminal-like domain-containing protein, partial [Acidimicrobiales bacterium]